MKHEYLSKASFLFLLIITVPVFAQKNIQLKSPDGNIFFSFKLTEKAPVYQVAYKGKTLIKDSELGLTFKESGKFNTNLKISAARFSKVDETYDLVVGKAKTIKNKYSQVLIPLTERTGQKRQINIIVRAFNDGLAFRYEFPKQLNWSSYTLLD
ncbi:MAG: glycoside hydrolase family 97 N-terminal domain-containing protein, partial [Segetibacter sp.]|nr:glycoside hydrolase family 97 N-terminal domain-containing protein [Segetibacter sp.]